MSSPQRVLVELMTSEQHAEALKKEAIELRCQAMRSASGNATLLRKAQILDMRAKAILRSGRVA